MQATPATFDQCQMSLFVAGSPSVVSGRRADMETGVPLLIAKKSVEHGMHKSSVSSGVISNYLSTYLYIGKSIT